MAFLYPEAEQLYREKGWLMFNEIDRVYVSESAVSRLGWRPRWHFGQALQHLLNGADFRSSLARAVGKKGYHAVQFREGPYPVEPR